MRAFVISSSEVLGPNSPLSRALEGYEHRPSQLEMAHAVEEALRADRTLFVEAGTGTGKTLAYLVPAILSRKKVIISTATKALQEQIFIKDLPLVRSILAEHGIEFKAALMKGLSNYLCRRRLQELRTSGARSDLMLARLEAWAHQTETGDKAELFDIPEDGDLWRAVQSTPETRIGASCTYYDECFVTGMRRDADEADVVIVNHHLFCADLALRTGKGEGYASAIPNYDVVIFDEAHQLEDIATDFFGIRISSARIESIVRDAERTLAASKKLELLKTGGPRVLLERVRDASQALFGGLLATMRAGESRRVLGPDDVTPAVLDTYGALDVQLAALGAYAQENAADESIGIIARRVQDVRRDMYEIVEGARSPKQESPDGVVDGERRVLWIEVRERSVVLGASPISLGNALRERLFDRVPSVICTSATLATAVGATGPSMRWAKTRLGAPDDSKELVLASPFDFRSRALLYVPRDLPEPADPRFDDQAAERIVDLIRITEGGAFVLCTSVRAMKALHERIKRKIEWPIMIQGEMPKQKLLSRFRAAKNAVLVATMSFWEGVDVPGQALRLVIIDKIPFAVPTDPVVMARCAEIESSGGNPFVHYSVPLAQITLKQGFGRLIRTQLDTGIVAILDRRIVTKGYGRALLSSLPDARRAAILEDVRAFWSAASIGQGERNG